MPSDFIYFVCNWNEINQLGSLPPAFNKTFFHITKALHNLALFWMIGNFYSGETKEWNAKGFAGQCFARTILENLFCSLEML